MPVSRTASWISVAAARTESTTSPSSVNLIAFASRLSRICRTRCASVGSRRAPRRRRPRDECPCRIADSPPPRGTRAPAADIDRRQPHVDAPRFGFRQIEDVVDEAQQMLAIALNALERLARARRQLLLGRRDQQVREARIALSGVRSSWLIEARNSVLTLFARANRSPCSASATLLSRRRLWVHALCRARTSWRAASLTEFDAHLRSGRGFRQHDARPACRFRWRWGRREPSRSGARRPQGRESGGGSARVTAVGEDGPRAGSSRSSAGPRLRTGRGRRLARRRPSLRTGTQPVGVVEQVDDAHLCVGKPDEGL